MQSFQLLSCISVSKNFWEHFPLTININFSETEDGGGAEEEFSIFLVAPDVLYRLKVVTSFLILWVGHWHIYPSQGKVYFRMTLTLSALYLLTTVSLGTLCLASEKFLTRKTYGNANNTE